MNQSKEMARIAYHALSDKKGEDIKVIDITEHESNGLSDTQGLVIESY